MNPLCYWIAFSLAVGEWCLLDLIAGEDRLANGLFVAFHALAIFMMVGALRQPKEGEE